MEWVNYHHLLYFRTVAREGSITRASKVLALAQPTISGQIRALEETLGEKLFMRQGRNLVLTDFGRTVYRYADEIFTLGQEMTEVLKGGPGKRPARLAAGISDTFSSDLACRVLSPALEMEEPAELLCQEGTIEQLLSGLQMHGLDLILTDTPVTPGGRIEAFSQLLGTSGISLFVNKEVASEYSTGFPHALDGAPFLLPPENSTLRRSLDHWFSDVQVRPRCVGEFRSSGLLQSFAQHARGLFFAPTVVGKEVQERCNVTVVGHVPGLQERYYVISAERRFSHPAVNSIVEAARSEIFRQQENQDEAA